MIAPHTCPAVALADPILLRPPAAPHFPPRQGQLGPTYPHHTFCPHIPTSHIRPPHTHITHSAPTFSHHTFCPPHPPLPPTAWRCSPAPPTSSGTTSAPRVWLLSKGRTNAAALSMAWHSVAQHSTAACSRDRQINRLAGV